LLLSTTPSDFHGVCDGTITVRATGSAGPFTIYVYDHVQDVEIERVGITGDITLTGLCNASYDVEVYPTRFPDCVKTMKAYVQPQKGLTVRPADAVGEWPEGELRVTVSPNPAVGLVAVTVAGLPAVQEGTRSNRWSFKILDAGGQEVKAFAYTTEVEAGKRSRRFPLDLKGLRKGAYFVRVVRNDGVEGVGRVVVQ
ncbi:MAG: T9SS type A sorting domain-containing protein, partial [Bacteroidota bacterium]